MTHKSDAELIRETRNSARFFVENRQLGWVLLLMILIWGIYGYRNMPKRKDPEIPVRTAMIVCAWPGASAEQVEQLVTRKIEKRVAENSNLRASIPGGDYAVKSLSLEGVSQVEIQLDSKVTNVQGIFSDINLKLKGISDLPEGAGPIEMFDDFGETTALMITVASPKEDAITISLRAAAIRRAIVRARSGLPAAEATTATSIVAAFPTSISPQVYTRLRDVAIDYLKDRDLVREVRLFDGPGFLGFDASIDLDENVIEADLFNLVQQRFGTSSFDPDAWPPIVIRDPAETESKLAAVAGAKYTYRQLDRFTDLIERTLETVAQVSKVKRRGVQPEEIDLEYSQERLAAHGLQPAQLQQMLTARNITSYGGAMQVEGAQLAVHPSGRFRDANQIGDVIVGKSPTGAPAYLRDLVDISRSYQSPPRFLNFYTARNAQGDWQTYRAITLAVYMRSGEQIGTFGAAVDRALKGVMMQLPEGLIIARTSDQPRQVHEQIGIFMDSLYEAIFLVVIVAFIGFGEWRSAVLMALSIPLTLAMTFGMAHLLGIDLQQVSIAALIIALGLLVDDPVVAGDAIKRELAMGRPPSVAAWLGPTKLAQAILFATITNIVAYLPFLLLTGNTGQFLYSLPIVMTCALVASRIVSMTMIPLLGYYLLRASAKPALSIQERRQRGFTGFYYRVGVFSIEHRWAVFVCSIAFLALGVFFRSQLKTAFFPDDLQYLSYVDLWLPNSATLFDAEQTGRRASRIVQNTAEQYSRDKAASNHAAPQSVLQSITMFVGGGGPRFWFSVSPEPAQLNYTQLVIQITDQHDMPALVARIQAALSKSLTGAIADVEQLQINPVQRPIEILISGRADDSPANAQADIRTLRQLAGKVESIFRSIPIARRVRSDWGEESPAVELRIDPDRANLAGVSNQTIAASSAAGLSGLWVATLLEGDVQIPIVARLRRQERGTLGDLKNLYVYSSSGNQKIPLASVASVDLVMDTNRIVRRDHFRTISVFCFPAPGTLASDVMRAADAGLAQFNRTLPPGFAMAIGGVSFKQKEGFGELGIVLLISVALIFLALVIQFKDVIKPILVFSAVPYGAVGALGALYLMGAPFGFMAYLGIASLVGVIVSHVIVLFDFIEDNREQGEPLIESLLDAGVARLRPVMITVGTTILALVPLALHGGPLWEPLCYAQIGGLTLATIIELLLVKVFYSIFVLDLKILKWDSGKTLQSVSTIDSGRQAAL